MKITSNRGWPRDKAKISTKPLLILITPSNSIRIRWRSITTGGVIKARKGDIEGAIADFDRAVERDPKYPHAYLNRGIARQTKSDFAGALSDYIRYSGLGLQGLPNNYVSLYIWLVRIRQNGIAEANKELSSYLEQRRDASAEDWVYKIGEFLLDKMSEADLFIAANSPEAGKRRRLCDAWYFSGMKHVLTGDKRGLRGLADRSPFNRPVTPGVPPHGDGAIARKVAGGYQSDTAPIARTQPDVLDGDNFTGLAPRC